MKESKKLIIAHRGASALVSHDNTLESFEKAIEIGAPAMEFDVRLTKDNIMVSFHDEFIQENIKIRDIDYNELQLIAHKKGFSVPTVEEILQISQYKIKLDIELKEIGYERELVRLVKKYLSYDDYYMKSFFDQAIINIKNIDANIKTGLLLGVDDPKHGVFTRIGEFFPYYRIIKTKCDFISPNYRLLRLGFIKRMNMLKKPIFVWTVNSENMMKLLLTKDISAIITDHPDTAMKLEANH